MQIIEKLSDMIEEELHDAEKYIRCAMDKKADNDYRAKNGEPPEKMQGDL